MRSILVQAGRDKGMAARLDTAMALARLHGAHMTLLIDTPIDRFITVDPYGGSAIAREAFEAALAEDDALAAACAGRLANDDVPFDVVQFECQPIEAMAGAARMADLAIISRDCGYAGDLPLEVRCPVLVMPDKPTALTFPLASAAIAWDGGSEAAFAMRCAIPLLHGCENVRIVAVKKPKDSDMSGTDVGRYLSRHGIKAELVEVAKVNSIEETLAASVAEQGAQLLVMGAYSHSRIREFLFGGVSRYFLEDAAAPPLLLAH